MRLRRAGIRDASVEVGELPSLGLGIEPVADGGSARPALRRLSTTRVGEEFQDGPGEGPGIAGRDADARVAVPDERVQASRSVTMAGTPNAMAMRSRPAHRGDQRGMAEEVQHPPETKPDDAAAREGHPVGDPQTTRPAAQLDLDRPYAGDHELGSVDPASRTRRAARSGR